MELLGDGVGVGHSNWDASESSSECRQVDECDMQANECYSEGYLVRATTIMTA